MPCPLSAMTKTLFDNVLELSAVASSLRIVREALPNATTPENGGFRATTDFPVLRCGKCGLPVLPREAWLHVLLGQSLAEEDLAADSLDHADAPGQETWRITHADCTPEQVGRYEISLPTTFREFIGLTADLLNKSWIADTDLSSLLGEASDLTGRFAPAPVEQLRNSSIRRHGSSWR